MHALVATGIVGGIVWLRAAQPGVARGAAQVAAFGRPRRWTQASVVAPVRPPRGTRLAPQRVRALCRVRR